MDVVFDPAGVPFDSVHRVTLVISILGSVVSAVVEELLHDVKM